MKLADLCLGVVAVSHVALQVDRIVLDALVEQCGRYETYALEVVFARQVEVVRGDGLQVGVAQCDFNWRLLGVVRSVGYEVGVLGACQRLGVRGAHLEVVGSVPFDEEARQPAYVVVLELARWVEAFVSVLVDVPVEAACLKVSVLHAEAGHYRELASQLLREAQVCGCNLLGCVIVRLRHSLLPILRAPARLRAGPSPSH